MNYLKRIINYYRYTNSLILSIKIFICYMIWFIWDKLWIKKENIGRLQLLFNWNYYFKTPFWNFLTSDFSNWYYFMMDDYEAYIQKIFAKKIAKNNKMNIVDIWAHIWRHAVWFAYDNPNVKVFAFEPHPDTFRSLKINTILSKVEDRVFIYNYWLWDKDESLIFENDIFSSWTNKFSSDKHIKWIKVESKAFDSIWKEMIKPEDIDMIIIDVEWFQLNTLKWMNSTLSKLSKECDLIVEINPWDESEWETIAYLNNLWFEWKKISKRDYHFIKSK